jgi:hypothetical protein
MKNIFYIVLITISLFACGEKQLKNGSPNLLIDHLKSSTKINSNSVLDTIKSLTNLESTSLANFNRKWLNYSNKYCQIKVLLNPNESLHHIKIIKSDTLQFEAEYASNGQIQCLFQFNNSGNRHGSYKCFNEDGTVRLIGEYLNGKEK